jgi:hypothetical protein
MFERRGAEIIAWFMYGLGFCVGGMYCQCSVVFRGLGLTAIIGRFVKSTC